MADYTIRYRAHGPVLPANYKITFEGPQRSNYCHVYFPSIANMIEFAKHWDNDPPLFHTSIKSIEKVESEKD